MEIKVKINDEKSLQIPIAAIITYLLGAITIFQSVSFNTLTNFFYNLIHFEVGSLLFIILSSSVNLIFGYALVTLAVLMVMIKPNIYIFIALAEIAGISFWGISTLFIRTLTYFKLGGFKFILLSLFGWTDWATKFLGLALLALLAVSFFKDGIFKKITKYWFVPAIFTFISLSTSFISVMISFFSNVSYDVQMAFQTLGSNIFPLIVGVLEVAFVALVGLWIYQKNKITSSETQEDVE